MTATTTIRRADLVETVAAALQYISYYHPADYIAHLARAYAREQSPAAKDAIAQILTNSRLCAEGKRPICQDTGIVNVFLEIGMEIRFEGFSGSIEDAVNEGVRRGFMDEDNKLRASIVGDPEFARRNTGDNTPAVIHMTVVPGSLLLFSLPPPLAATVTSSRLPGTTVMWITAGVLSPVLRRANSGSPTMLARSLLSSSR